MQKILHFLKIAEVKEMKNLEENERRASYLEPSSELLRDN